MPVLFQYCLLSLGSPFLLAMSVWLVVLNLLYFTNTLIDYLILYHTGFWDCFLLFIYYQPSFLVLAIPIGFLTGLLVAYGRISADREFLALQASGLSASALLWPLGILSAIFSLFLVVFMDVILPWGNTSAIKLEYRIQTEHSTIAVKERMFVKDFSGYEIYVDQKEESTGRLRNVTVLMLDDKGYPYRVVYSGEGSLQQNPDLHIILRLEKGVMQQLGTRLTPGFSNLLQLKFSKCDLDLNAQKPPFGPLDANSARNMKIQDLAKRIRDERLKKQDCENDEVEFQKKFSLPFSAMAFAFIGVPLGLITRGGSFLGPVVAVMLVGIYDGFLMLGDNGGFLGRYSPFWAMWAPNIFLLVVGFLLTLWIDHRLWLILSFRSLAKGAPADRVKSS